MRSHLVVSERDMLPFDRLLVIFLLFELEYVTHEELLEVLVGEVDAELLEAACANRTCALCAHRTYLNTNVKEMLFAEVIKQSSTSNDRR